MICNSAMLALRRSWRARCSRFRHSRRLFFLSRPGRGPYRPRKNELACVLLSVIALEKACCGRLPSGCDSCSGELDDKVVKVMLFEIGRATTLSTAFRMIVILVELHFAGMSRFS